ncbi:hypothetical protein VNO77_46350 [Canavalia gladiata]|uniref:Uncharacterized protein n=1 Tax=Canavalia gladiata TaxID=3824 RepID=A0AAN9PHN3_CANGL
MSIRYYHLSSRKGAFTSHNGLGPCLASDIGCADRRLATSHLERSIYEPRAFRVERHKESLNKIVKGFERRERIRTERVFRSCISFRQE